MKRNNCDLTIAAAVACAVSLTTASSVLTGPPQYNIFDLGLVDQSDISSQGFGVSPDGVAVGRSLGTSNQALSWTLGGGLVGLPNHPSRDFSVANGANDSGAVVGIGVTTFTGTVTLPILW